MNETDARVPPRHPSVMFALVVLIGLTMFGAGVAWQTFFRSFGVDQPLTITACTPESYDPPDIGQRGPSQAECVAPGSETGDTWPASEPIPVTGQVCNDSTEPVSYTVAVSWQSVDTPGLSTQIINVPITYEPGCQPPYVFEFEFPSEVADAADYVGVSLGRWRIVGVADPVDRSRYTRYQWDAVKTVEIVRSK